MKLLQRSGPKQRAGHKHGATRPMAHPTLIRLSLCAAPSVTTQLYTLKRAAPIPDLLDRRGPRPHGVEALSQPPLVLFGLALVVLEHLLDLGVVGGGDYGVEHGRDVALHGVRVLHVVDQLLLQPIVDHASYLLVGSQSLPSSVDTPGCRPENNLASHPLMNRGVAASLFGVLPLPGGRIPVVFVDLGAQLRVQTDVGIQLWAPVYLLLA